MNGSTTPRTFSATVDSLRYGKLGDELTQQLVDLTKKCQDAGKSGAITLTLALKPGKGGQMEVFDDIKIKSPKEERGSSIMFATEEGTLQREDPRQHKLPGIRSVDEPVAKVRESIDPGTGEVRAS